MSLKVKLCSGKEVVQKLQKVGWVAVRQRGFHMMMVKKGYSYTLSVPQHKKLGIGILKKIIKQAQLDVAKFNKL